MPEKTAANTAATDLTSQYRSQVDTDLENNTKEQERLTSEIAALQEQLTTLQHEHSVLVNVQQALGGPAPAQPAPAPERTGAAGSGEKAPASQGRGRPAPAKKASARNGAPARKAAARKSSAKKTATKAGTTAGGTASKSAPSQPTLVELIRRHLTEQGEPRSAAEVATALGKAHPDRGIKTTVVRTTLEGLVARNRAQRTKQGRSVFYSTSGTPTGGAADESR
ncbi:hypothetical protein [Streptomyces minutiscleroticus]|uniref:hypothetical protein n=1 Tax=Streptomyces minutiscleroticus TaxID=68238 RepID=UPI00332A68F6